MSEEKIKKEILQNNLIVSRAELVVSLRKFCESESQHEPCLNYHDCDDCDVRKRIEELKQDVIYLW